jgi:hypothetical protein
MFAHAVGDLNSQVEYFIRFQSLATHLVAKCSSFEALHGRKVLRGGLVLEVVRIEFVESAFGRRPFFMYPHALAAGNTSNYEAVFASFRSASACEVPADSRNRWSP